MSDVAEQIRQKLAVLEPHKIELIDESAKHAGHQGATGGGGHYRLMIVSAQFKGMNAIQRHRAIYSALGDMMQEQIHALSITAVTPDEL